MGEQPKPPVEEIQPVAAPESEVQPAAAPESGVQPAAAPESGADTGKNIADMAKFQQDNPLQSEPIFGRGADTERDIREQEDWQKGAEYRQLTDQENQLRQEAERLNREQFDLTEGSAFLETIKELASETEAIVKAIDLLTKGLDFVTQKAKKLEQVTARLNEIAAEQQKIKAEQEAIVQRDLAEQNKAT
jgi:hypothetical protein